MSGEDLTHLVTNTALQLAFILLAAKLAGEVSTRYLKIPPVLGEIFAGVAIGPYALGGAVLFGFGPFFAQHAAGDALSLLAVPTEIWVFGQIASVVLLFMVGLETNLKQFFRYAGPATVVAMGGVVAPFVLGVGATVHMGFADGYFTPEALFVGSIMTATSVGITARVLTDLHRMRSPEGVTIIGAAVVDDVIGILILAVVVAMAATGTVSTGELGVVAAKAVGFWVVLLGVMLVLGGTIARTIGWFRNAGAPLVLGMALALLGAGLAELFGLAMIIGAYTVGLGLSNTPLKRQIEAKVGIIYNFMVPVFFVVMGMLVDLSAIGGVLGFGAVLTALAVLSKVLGSGLPALAVGFNRRGAWRIGLGMLPRGEVALIIAGIGVSRGIIDQDIFGVAILMTVVTTLVAPILLVPAFRSGGDGHRHPEGADASTPGSQPAGH